MNTPAQFSLKDSPGGNGPTIPDGGYLGQRDIRPGELPWIMRRHIYTGAMGTIWGMLTSVAGVFVIYFRKEIGLTDANWGFMVGISSFLLCSAVFAARLTRQVGRRELLWFWFSMATRTIRLVGIILAWWLWRNGYEGGGLILIASICLAQFLGAMADPPWYSWLADIIPQAIHGRFWARRTWWTVFTAMVVGLLLTWIMQYQMREGWDEMPVNLKMNTVLVIFLAATIVGLLDIVIHATIPEPPMAGPKENASIPGAAPTSGSLARCCLLAVCREARDFSGQFMEPLRDREFRPWLVFTASWNFAFNIAGTIIAVYQMDRNYMNLGRNFFLAFVVMTVLNQVGTLLSAHVIGRYVDRYGVRQALFWGYLGWAILPLLWFFMTPATAPYVVATTSLIAGIFINNATGIAGNKYITRFTPPGHHVATYAAANTFVIYFVSGVGALITGVILQATHDWHGQILGFAICTFQLLLGVSFVLRLGTALVLLPRVRISKHLADASVAPAAGDGR